MYRFTSLIALTLTLSGCISYMLAHEPTTISETLREPSQVVFTRSVRVYQAMSGVISQANEHTGTISGHAQEGIILNVQVTPIEGGTLVDATQRAEFGKLPFGKVRAAEEFMTRLKAGGTHADVR